jgi:hypothetical protein
LLGYPLDLGRPDHVTRGESPASVHQDPYPKPVVLRRIQDFHNAIPHEQALSLVFYDSGVGVLGSAMSRLLDGSL